MNHAMRSLFCGICCLAVAVCGAAASELRLADKVGGKYEIKGKKKTGDKVVIVSQKGSNDSDEQISIEIDWPITKAQFDDLKDGQSTFKIRGILELDKFDLEPFGAKTRFRVICKNGSAKVTLEFAGSDPELKSKAESGLK